MERTPGEGDTIHAKGFAKEGSPDFHAGYLASHGFPLADCRKCHGDDYHGGSSQSSCTKSGCHEQGVESCGTCHEAHPTTGAHGGHELAGKELACTECHPPRVDARMPEHPDGHVNLAFGPLASSNGFSPTFDEATLTCQNVYCHGGKPRVWQESGKLGCDGCHGAPPASHAQFATAQSDCTSCHGSTKNHLDGKVDREPLACDACHGKGADGAPPPGLLGATASPSVGAHARHLDASLPDRIGHIARCDQCHSVPASVDAAGHLDASAPADVTLRTDESYDVASKSCVVGCHWDRTPGPRWDDTSGLPRACDACHGMPPVKTRKGTPHPPAAPSLSVCVTCHVFDPSTHVDGKVDFAP